MPLPQLPPDPQPSEDELRQEMARLQREGKLPVRAVPGIDLQWLRDQMARLAWQVRRRAEDPDSFCVRFASDIPENYKADLQSPQWKAIHDNVLAEARYECACCFNKATEVHHRDYRPRVLRGEDLSPLVALCHGCHEKIERDYTWAKPESWNDKERVLAELVARKEASRHATARRDGAGDADADI